MAATSMGGTHRRPWRAVRPSAPRPPRGFGLFGGFIAVLTDPPETVKPSGATEYADYPDPLPSPPSPSPIGVHPGYTCDRSGMYPIVGLRYHLRDADFDLCQAEYDKLEAREKAQYEAIAADEASRPAPAASALASSGPAPERSEDDLFTQLRKRLASLSFPIFGSETISDTKLTQPGPPERSVKWKDQSTAADSTLSAPKPPSRRSHLPARAKSSPQPLTTGTSTSSLLEPPAEESSDITKRKPRWWTQLQQASNEKQRQSSRCTGTLARRDRGKQRSLASLFSSEVQPHKEASMRSSKGVSVRELSREDSTEARMRQKQREARERACANHTPSGPHSPPSTSAPTSQACQWSASQSALVKEA